MLGTEFRSHFPKTEAPFRNSLNALKKPWVPNATSHREPPQNRQHYSFRKPKHSTLPLLSAENLKKPKILQPQPYNFDPASSA